MERLFTMIINRFLRMAVNRGMRKGMSKMSNGNRAKQRPNAGKPKSRKPDTRRD